MKKMIVMAALLFGSVCAMAQTDTTNHGKRHGQHKTWSNDANPRSNGDTAGTMRHHGQKTNKGKMHSDSNWSGNKKTNKGNNSMNPNGSMRGDTTGGTMNGNRRNGRMNNGKSDMPMIDTGSTTMPQ